MRRMLFSRLLIVLVVGVAVLGLIPPDAQDTSVFGKYRGFLLPRGDGQTTVVASANAAESKAEPAAEPQKKDDGKPQFIFDERKLGEDSAPLKLKLFSSMTCVHCAHFATQSLPALQEKYVKTGKMQIIFFDFPLEERAMVASLISKCLPDDRYFAFVSALYAAQMKWMMSHNLQEALEPYARMAGLPKDKMIACATNAEALNKMMAKRQEYISKYQVNATPMLILETSERIRTISGAPSDEKEFENMLNAMIAEASMREKLSENARPAVTGAP